MMCETFIMNAIVDRFEKQVPTVEIDDNHLKMTATVSEKSIFWESLSTRQCEMIGMNNRIYGSISAGEDYSEIYFLDEECNIVEKNLATYGVIQECKMDGTLLKKTWSRCDSERQQEK